MATPIVTSVPSTNPAAVTTPAQPVVETLEGGELTTNADGTVEVRVKTGEVFKGTQKEVLASLTKAQAHTHEYASGLKQELATKNAPPPAPVIEATAEEIQLRNYLADQLAKKFGLESGDQLVANFQNMFQVTTNAGAQMASATFYAQNPDFPTSDANIEKMFGVLEKIGGNPNNVDHLSAAHAVCVKTNVYQPLTPEQIRSLGPTPPPPMIQSSNVETTNPTGAVQEVNVNMTQAQILAAIKANTGAKPK